MIGKIFGFNKKSDYFLELEDSKGTESAQTQPAKKEEAKPAAVEAQPAKAKAEEPKAAAKTSKKAKTTKAKAKPAPQQAKEEAKATVEAISVKPKELPSFNNGLESTPAGMTFATDYLMKQPSSTRRRPGPSMNMFKDIARQVGRR